MHHNTHGRHWNGLAEMFGARSILSKDANIVLIVSAIPSNFVRSELLDLCWLHEHSGAGMPEPLLGD